MNHEEREEREEDREGSRRSSATSFRMISPRYSTRRTRATIPRPPGLRTLSVEGVYETDPLGMRGSHSGVAAAGRRAAAQGRPQGMGRGMGRPHARPGGGSGRQGLVCRPGRQLHRSLRSEDGAVQALRDRGGHESAQHQRGCERDRLVHRQSQRPHRPWCTGGTPCGPRRSCRSARSTAGIAWLFDSVVEKILGGPGRASPARRSAT